jgi:4-amino-4-deoxy-L-arabinose transferase-like glycosyltransferase
MLALTEPSAAAFSSSSLPRHVLGWIPYLWTQVLFPGDACTPEPIRTRSLLILLVLPALLLYVSMAFPLFEPDEGRYAEIPREMMVRGEWVVPYLQAEPYLDKPPLLYWLVNLGYRALGTHVWAARLVPALAIHLCVLLTYVLGRRILGERAAFYGALMLALAPGFVSIGRLLVLDGLLTLWVTLSIFAAFEALRGERLRWGWWLLAAIACGLGVLTKGPIAAILLTPPIWAYRRLTGKSCPIGWRAVAAFTALTLVVVLPWYLAICVRRPDFASYFLLQHNLMRFLSPFDHLQPIWFYGPVLLLGLLPATLLLVPFLRFLMSGDASLVSRRSRELGFVLLAGGWCLLFFSLSGSKLPTYIMPAFPPLCLALGYYLAGSRWMTTRWPGTVAALAFAIVCLGHNLLLPWYAGYRAPLGRIAEFEEYCADPATPIIFYPRNCDSIAFHLQRDDLRTFRSKETNVLVEFLRQRPRTVVVFTHRHSLDALRHAFTPDLELVQTKHMGLERIPGLSNSLMDRVSNLMGETSLGLCDVAVVLHKQMKPGTPESKSWNEQQANSRR